MKTTEMMGNTQTKDEEYLYLPTKHGMIQVPRYSEPLPTKDGHIQFVFTVQDQVMEEIQNCL